jgi:hypothetical protein
MDLPEAILSFFPLADIYACCQESIAWYPLLVRETKERINKGSLEPIELALSVDYLPIIRYYLSQHIDGHKIPVDKLLVLAFNHSCYSISSYLMARRYSSSQAIEIEKHTDWNSPVFRRGGKFAKRVGRFLRRHHIDDIETMDVDDSFYLARYRSISNYIYYRQQLTDHRFIIALVDLYPEDLEDILADIISVGVARGAVKHILQAIIASEDEDLVDRFLEERSVSDRDLFLAIDLLRQEREQEMEEALDSYLLQSLHTYRPSFLTFPTLLIRRYDSHRRGVASLWSLLDEIIRLNRSIPKQPYEYLAAYLAAIQDTQTYGHLLYYRVDVA